MKARLSRFGNSKTCDFAQRHHRSRYLAGTRPRDSAFAGCGEVRRSGAKANISLRGWFVYRVYRAIRSCELFPIRCAGSGREKGGRREKPTRAPPPWRSLSRPDPTLTDVRSGSHQPKNTNTRRFHSLPTRRRMPWQWDRRSTRKLKRFLSGRKQEKSEDLLTIGACRTSWRPKRRRRQGRRRTRAAAAECAILRRSLVTETIHTKRRGDQDSF